MSGLYLGGGKPAPPPPPPPKEQCPHSKKEEEMAPQMNVIGAEESCVVIWLNMQCSVVQFAPSIFR